MAQSPDKKATPHVDVKTGDAEISFLNDETRRLAIECIQKRGKLTISSKKLESTGLSSEVAWEQKVD